MIDLDELMLLCRDDQAKQYIAEAVACYRAGAYRSCIVSTWIAVSFDFVAKIRDLDLAGDKNASVVLVAFEETVRKGDVTAALSFERSLLSKARDDFQFLSAIEHDDLERLWKDRNRCAHPSMRSESEPYRPSAELARYHLRNAVSHLLSQPPVQGKAALDRLLKEIHSPYFPNETELAVKRLSLGPLGRARQSLVENFVRVLTKDLILSERGQDERERQMAALTAVYRMYAGMSEGAMSEVLPRVIEETKDKDWPRVLSFVRNVPVAWEMLGERGRMLAEAIVENPPNGTAAQVAIEALHIPGLAERAQGGLEAIPTKDLIEQVQIEPISAFVSVAVRKYADAGSFAQANELGQSLLIPLAPFFTLPDLESVVATFEENTQVNGSFAVIDVLSSLFDQPHLTQKDSEPLWERVNNKILKTKYLPDTGEDLQARMMERFDSLVPF